MTHGLVSIVMFAYKQEAYVEHALNSALAQDYPSLEIIASDDASPDATFEIIQRVVDGYRGPHRVVVNRNAENMGLIRHMEKAVGMTSGGLIVLMAGDDISYPWRVTVLAEAWGGRASCPLVYGLHSRVSCIDASGEPVPAPVEVEATFAHSNDGCLGILRKLRGVHGASAAWTRDVFSRFAPIAYPDALEDLVLSFRAQLLGEIVFVDRVLAEYRVGVSTWIVPKSHAVTSASLLSRLRKQAITSRDTLLQMLEDLDQVERADKAVLVSELTAQLARYESLANLAKSTGVLAWLKWLVSGGPVDAWTAMASLQFAMPRLAIIARQLAGTRTST